MDQPVYVFFGTVRSAERFRRQNGLEPKDVLLAIRPERLRGRRCPLVRVLERGHWYQGVREADLAAESEYLVRTFNDNNGYGEVPGQTWE